MVNVYKALIYKFIITCEYDYIKFSFIPCTVKGIQVWSSPSNGTSLVAVHCTPRKLEPPAGHAYRKSKYHIFTWV